MPVKNGNIGGRRISEHEVSILVLLDAGQKLYKQNPDFNTPEMVSILVLLDAGQKLGGRVLEKLNVTKFQSLFYWMPVKNTNGEASYIGSGKFQSLFYWMPVKNKSFHDIPP